MPNGNQRKQNKRPNRKPTGRKRESYTRDSSAGRSIVRGIAGITNSFMPGAGAAVNGIARLFGVGAYDSDTASKLFANSVPQMHATLDEGIRVCHHEYLCDVNSVTAYGVSTFPINPGMSATFPWLSTLASAFTAWKANGIVFYFKSTSASALNSTNTALGQIIGCVDYNPYHTAPASKIAALGISGARDGKPSESNIFPVECKKEMTVIPTKMLRGSFVTDDLAKYDLGNFFLAANGSQASATVGELHIAYDVTLMKPKLGQSGWNLRYKSTDYTDSLTLGATGVIQFNPFGAQFDLTNKTVTLPAGTLMAGSKFLVQCNWHGVGTVTGAAPTVTATNTTPLLYFSNDTSNGVIAGAVASSASVSTTTTFRVTSGNTDVVITIGTGTLPTGGRAFELNLVELDPNSI